MVCKNKNNKTGICQPISCPRNYRSFIDFSASCIDNSTVLTHSTDGKEQTESKNL